MHTKTEQEEESTIQTLPDEILTEIFSYLPSENIRKKIRLVSRRFYSLSYDAGLWRSQFRLDSRGYFSESRYVLDPRGIDYSKSYGFLERWLNQLIHWAIRNKRQSLLNYFYQHGIVAHYEKHKKTKDINDRTLNHWAAICNQLNEFNNADTIANEDKDETGRTVLVIAAQYGHLDLVKKFWPINLRSLLIEI